MQTIFNALPTRWRQNQLAQIIKEITSLSPYVLNNPTHLNYVATLPCNLSIIDFFLILTFHKLVWQHNQGMVGFLTMTFTADLPRNLPAKKIENRLRFDRSMATSLWPQFLAHPVVSSFLSTKIGFSLQKYLVRSIF